MPETKDLPWPSDLEVETRSQLAELAQHQLRTDRLLMALQLEQRTLHRETQAKVDAMGKSVEDLVRLVRLLTSNGHGAEPNV